ncbi:uncharacterized protein LOC121752401 isoform X2 [Salvia splendens]|uniref:uncharacterized protein LOC121752401 isoform X2 n=1 Tax=Salvia splendens TaxID=180675 RepID=UPI001C275BE7|nr:uncharacterized protein LOC121752401 isoform X2 [Salvia splendens]
MHFLISWLKCKNMSDAGASDASIVEQLKKSLMEYGSELLKPYDCTEVLTERLDKLEHLLSGTPQKYKKLLETFLQPCKEALITRDLIGHSELDVRVSVASCISQIIRITAPDEPYGEVDMKEFFNIANSAFGRFPCMYGRAYSKAVSILHTMSFSESCLMMLDLELHDSILHMFHLFLGGIRTEHPYEVFINMEKIMTTVIHNNVDYDEFSLVLVKTLLNNLRKENQIVAPVSFKLAGNTLKNCSADLKTYLPEAVESLDAPIEDYAEVVVSLFQDATQKQITDSTDTVENVFSPGEAGLTVEVDLCNQIEGNETQNSKNDDNSNENQGMISHSLDDPDKLGKAMHMPQQKPEELPIGRKRIRRPSSLKNADEGYDPFWMLVDWRSMKSGGKKNKNTNCPAKTKMSKNLSPKLAGKNISGSISPKPSKMKKETKRYEGVSPNKTLEPTSEGVAVASEDEDQTRGSIVKSHFGKGHGSLIKVSPVKKRRETILSEDLKEDIPDGIQSRAEKEQGSLTKASPAKKCRRKAIVSDDLKEDIISHSEKEQGSLMKVSPVKKSRRKVIVSKDLKEDIMGHSVKGQGSLTNASHVKKSRRKAIVPEGPKEDIAHSDGKQSHSGKGQGSLTKLSPVKKSRRKPHFSEDLKEDIVHPDGIQSLSEKGQESLKKGSPAKKRRRKTVVSVEPKDNIESSSEKGQSSLTKMSPGKKNRRKSSFSVDLKEDIATLPSQCRPMSSQAKSRSAEVCKENLKGSMPRPGKRAASETVGGEVIGCRVKVWWPLDQKFYKGKIMDFYDLNKTHKVTYDDGETEILDLTSERWELLRDINLSADEEPKIGAESADPSPKAQ